MESDNSSSQQGMAAAPQAPQMKGGGNKMMLYAGVVIVIVVILAAVYFIMGKGGLSSGGTLTPYLTKAQLSSFIGNASQFVTYNLTNSSNTTTPGGGSRVTLAELKTQLPTFTGNLTGGWATLGISNSVSQNVTTYGELYAYILKSSNSSGLYNAAVTALTQQTGGTVGTEGNGTAGGMTYDYFTGPSNNPDLYYIGYKGQYTAIALISQLKGNATGAAVTAFSDPSQIAANLTVILSDNIPG
jgi:hypothetical protein